MGTLLRSKFELLHSSNEIIRNILILKNNMKYIEHYRKYYELVNLNVNQEKINKNKKS